MAANEAERARADDLHEAANELEDDDEALAAFEQVLAIDPDRASTHYNVGLIHKYRGNWAASRASNQRAFELAPEDEAVNWNLAIAATALGDWATARKVWHGLGYGVELGSEPIEADFGLTPVRLNPEGTAEVVWARRIDPVRARILNIPFPISGFRHGDIVLHDGAPVGYREHEGREYGVLNVLELFQPSSQATFELELDLATPEDLEAATQALDDAGLTAEDWTSNTRMLCRACSEGRPHEKHDHELPAEPHDSHVFGIAAPASADLEARLRALLPRRARILRFEMKLPARLAL